MSNVNNPDGLPQSKMKYLLAASVIALIAGYYLYNKKNKSVKRK
jgi:hypothetical protein